MSCFKSKQPCLFFAYPFHCCNNMFVISFKIYLNYQVLVRPEPLKNEPRPANLGDFCEPNRKQITQFPASESK